MQHIGPVLLDTKKGGPKYDEEGRFDDNELYPDVDVSLPIDHNNFIATLAKYPIGEQGWKVGESKGEVQERSKEGGAGRWKVAARLHS
jgi:hypothetical protein